MPKSETFERLTAERVGRLATSGSDGQPHVVPIVFACEGSRIVTAVDGKPKRSTDLRRLRNVEANPSVSLLVDRYDEDWKQLWWIRVDGQARVVRDGPDLEKALALLVAKYPQYRTTTVAGPAIVIDIERLSSWSA